MCVLVCIISVLVVFTRTWRSGLCYPQYACLSVACNVGAPYSGGWSFRQYFFTTVYLSHPLTFAQNFTEIVPGEPIRRGVKCKRYIKTEGWWTYRRLYLILTSRSGISSTEEFLVSHCYCVVLCCIAVHFCVLLITNCAVLPRSTFGVIDWFITHSLIWRWSYLI